MANKVILSVALLAASLAVASAMQRTHANEKLYAAYSRQKVFESCFGESNVASYNDRLREARARCSGQPSRALLDTPNSQGNFQYKNSDISGPQTYFTEGMVRYISEKLMAKTSNLSCVLNEMGHMDANDNINYQGLISDVQGLNGVDSTVKTDIINGINGCRDMAECLPLVKIAYPLTPALMRWSTFSKCKMAHEYQACMKKDLRARRNEFELEGLGNFLSNYSDDDKMWAVIWARNVLNQGSDWLW